MAAQMEGDIPTDPLQQREENLRHARLWIRIDAAVHRLQEWVSKLYSRQHESDRGPQDYPIPRRRRYRDVSVNIEGYAERGSKEPSWQNWGMKIVATLIATGIGGLIWVLSSMNSRLSAIETQQRMATVAQSERLKADEDRITRIENKVFP